MKIIVITGKSGSGKSLVAKLLSEKLNSRALSLDEISHLSLENEDIKAKLFERFGKEIFDGENIDRKKLGEIVFNNQNELEFVNNLSWKFIDEWVDKFLESHSHERFIILEYALITKMKFFLLADYKILVNSDQAFRFKRLSVRDCVSEKYLLLREKNSLSFSENEFDFVIENNKTINKLCLEVENIAKKIQI